MLFPMRMRIGVELSGTFKSVEKDRRREAEIAQELRRKAGRNIPARAERGFRTLERLGVAAAETGVRGHDSSRRRAS